MTYFKSTIWILLCLTSVLGAQSAWLAERTEQINAAEKLPPNEMFEKIGYLLEIGAGKNPRDEQKAVFKRVQYLMLQNPGHARYYKNKLDKAREDFLNKRISYHTYTEIQDELGVLRYLPSAETVAVLGELVEDPVGRDGELLGGAGSVSYGDGWFPVNALIASGSLGSLGIEGGPVTSPLEEDQWAAVDRWKEWWKEVKDGKRTYRFKGSPTVYDANGPVTGEKLQKIERENKREEDRSSTHGQGSTAARTNPALAIPKASPFAMIAAALAVMVSLVWYFAKARSRWGQ